MRFRSLCPLFCAAAALLLVACHQSAPRPPNIVLVVIDTLRADRLGAYGDTRRLTPFLDAVAARGTVFSNTYAASSWTPPSVASLFTSRFPSQHHVTRGDSKLADEEITLAERLASGGYASAGFSANLRLTTALGFAQGFGHWVHHPHGPTKPRGSTLREESLAWVDRTCAAPQSHPCLLYLQYMEPHAPYEPPEPFRSRYGREVPGAPDIETANQDLIRRPFAKLPVPEVELLESYYDGEVAAVDAELRQLFDELRQRRFLDNAIVVITADHGEEFLDHGRVSHGTALYNETIRVPLLLQGTGIPSGRVVTENVSLVDVAPTLLDLAGLPPEPNFEGRSLAPLITPPSAPAGRRERLPGDPPGESRDILAELERTDTKLDFRRHTSSILRGSVKLLVNQPHGTNETYDLARDPGERTPLASEDGKAAAVLARALEELRASLQIRKAELAERGRVDEATREKLRALGYEP